MDYSTRNPTIFSNYFRHFCSLFDFFHFNFEWNPCNSQPIGPEPIVGIPISKIKYKISIHRTTRFNDYWGNLAGCNQAKNNIALNKKHSINISRTRLKVYTGVMMGHFDFNKQLKNIGKRQDSGCESCGDLIDSADHYLCRCPAFISSRHKCLGT